VVGGRVVGASDPQGGHPKTRPYRPADLAATIYSTLGFPADLEYPDRLGRPFVATRGTRIEELF
jgi:hypothetical protein